MEKLFFSLGIIAGGLTLGYLVQLVDRGGLVTLPFSIAVLRKTLQKIGLLFFMPISFLGAVWVVSFGDIRVAFLPFVGIFAIAAGGVLGLLLARVIDQSSKQTGVLFCCGSFTNIGAVGGLVCYMFLGEAGFALIALYKMFEEIVYYTIGFPIARFYSGEGASGRSLGKRILGVVTDPFVAAALSAFCIGLTLNLLHIVRPAFFETVTAVSIPVGTFIIIVSIGLGMRFSKVGVYLPACAGICVIKFLLVPAMTCLLAFALDLHLVAGGLPFKVVVVLSSMPVAFNALIASSIYDLDLDMANSCWLISTGGLVVVMPWLYFLFTSVLPL